MRSSLLLLVLLGGCHRLLLFGGGQPDGPRDLAPSDGASGETLDASRLEARQPALEARAPDARVLDGGGPDLPAGTILYTLPAGTFMMGSPESEPCRASDELQHQVTLSRGFGLMRTEVTREAFSALMGYDPSIELICTDPAKCPVQNLTWDEAAAYCNKLSTTGKLASCYACTGSLSLVTCTVAPAYAGQLIYNCPGFRLPTEAEWEYAYRAGTTTALYNNGPLTGCGNTTSEPDPIAWYSGNAAGVAHPVATKQANPWKLHDMAGNVWEYCHEAKGSYAAHAPTDPVGPDVGPNTVDRIIRGGSYAAVADFLRAANRGNTSKPDDKESYVGFRCARSL